MPSRPPEPFDRLKHLDPEDWRIFLSSGYLEGSPCALGFFCWSRSRQAADRLRDLLAVRDCPSETREKPSQMPDEHGPGVSDQWLTEASTPSFILSPERLDAWLTELIDLCAAADAQFSGWTLFRDEPPSA